MSLLCICWYELCFLLVSPMKTEVIINSLQNDFLPEIQFGNKIGNKSMSSWLCRTLPPCTGCDTRRIFKQSKTGLNSEFSSAYIDCLTKVKESSLFYYLPTAGCRRRDGFMPFQRVLVWSETQTVLSRIWTQVVDSISNDDNRYAKHTDYTKQECILILSSFYFLLILKIPRLFNTYRLPKPWAPGRKIAENVKYCM